MKKIIVFSGAGVSAESGLKTFRDSDGLWEEYNVYDVATPEAWAANQQLVLEFYNKRRKQILAASPNAAHYAIAALEKKYDVHVITQNIDNFHERAGSQKVLHLHGEITKSRSTVDPKLVYDISGWQLNTGDLCEKGSQLRPHIVWFGEMVPDMPQAYELAASADILIIVGTSLNVYPAAGLIHYTPPHCIKYLIDPNKPLITNVYNLVVIEEKASTGLTRAVEQLIQKGYVNK